jgi:hypothetical protein
LIGPFFCFFQSAIRNPKSEIVMGSPPYEGGVAAASADGVVLSSFQIRDPQSQIQNRFGSPPDKVGWPGRAGVVVFFQSAIRHPKPKEFARSTVFRLFQC